jgi:hypothetical protein
LKADENSVRKEIIKENSRGLTERSISGAFNVCIYSLYSGM